MMNITLQRDSLRNFKCFIYFHSCIFKTPERSDDCSFLASVNRESSSTRKGFRGEPARKLNDLKIKYII